MPSLAAFGRAFVQAILVIIPHVNMLLAAHDHCTAFFMLQPMSTNIVKEMTSSEAPALTSDSASSSFIRLHVTPFDTDLVKVILSSSILPNARNISYHTIDTFPESRYGFVDLPKEDADKLRRKLNGAVLKGVKIRIEPARASAIPEPLGQEAVMGGEKSSRRKEARDSGDKAKHKKRKRDNDEIPGAVIEEGRKVKRGWTTTDEPPRDKDRKKKDKKDKNDKRDKAEKKERKQAKSKYTDHEECLVKTILPPNVATNTTANEDGSAKKKKKRHGTQREVVVHEFEKSTKFPTFLRDSATSAGPAPAALEYVEGKGWVDAEGNVVQTVKPKRDETYKIKSSSKKSKKTEEVPVEEIEDASESHSDDSSLESDDDDAVAEPATKASPDNQPSQESEISIKSQSVHLSENSSTPVSPGPGSAKSLTIKIPPVTPKDKVHPLEALYKKPKQGDGEAAEEAKGFSFFGNADNDDIEDEDVAPGSGRVVPMTPFTREDIELRGIRSAAPTPDTAHPGRRFKPWTHEDEDIEEEGAEYDEDGEDRGSQADGSNAAAGQALGAGVEESTSDFQKWFWENRGDLNRSWKKRRKLAGKEKRYRENKARLARAI